MKLVGRIKRSALDGGEFVRVKYPPYDVLVALVDGEPYAIEDACNHAGASLAEGFRAEHAPGCIGCPMHGYLFDLKTGALVSPKGLCDAQRTFTTRIDGDEIVIYDPVQLTIF